MSAADDNTTQPVSVADVAVQAAALTHVAGRSKNTVDADKPALNLFNYYWKYVLMRAGGIDEEYIEEDNLTSLFVLYTHWLTKTPIPKYWTIKDGEMAPPSSANTDDAITILAKITLVKYVGKVIAWLKREFPNHPHFKNLSKTDPNAVPQWWTELKLKFEKDLDDSYSRLQDYDFGAKAIAPLYSQSKYNPKDYEDAGNIGIVSKICLQQVLHSLMKDAKIAATQDGPLQNRAILVVIFHCMARSGEPKYVDMANWEFHPLFELTSIMWQELKTNNIQAMPMVPEKYDFWSCFYHALGSFWAVESGLMRNENQRTFATHLFPSLHDKKADSVAPIIKNIVRDNLPIDCPTEIKLSLTGKSLRKSGVTQALIHRNLTLLDVVARSGHNLGTLESYQDKTNVSTGLRTAKALANHEDVDAHVSLPKLEGLPPSETTKLLHELFHVPDCLVSYFVPGGKLFDVIITVLASMIMHHNSVMKMLGHQNAVAVVLMNAATRARITDGRFPTLGPEQIISKWSDMVRERYDVSNSVMPRVSADGAGLSLAFNQQGEVLQKILLGQHKLESVVDRLYDIVDTQGVRITQLYQEKSMWEEEYSRLRTAYDVATSPGYDLRAKRQRLSHVAAPQVEAAPRTAAPAPAALAFSIPAATSAAAPAAAAAPPATTHPTVVPTLPPLTQARSLFLRQAPPTKNKTSDAKANIGAELINLHANGRLGGVPLSTRWCKVLTFKKHEDYNEPSLMTYSLELCEFVMSEDEKAQFRDKGLDRTELFTLASKVEERAFKKMYEFEGKNVEEEMENNKKNGSRAPKPTYQGLGKRVFKYKKDLARRRGLSDADIKKFGKDEDLIERPSDMAL